MTLDLADGLRLIHGADTGGHFGHEAHLRFAWDLLDLAENLDEAERVATTTIRHVAELAGNPQKYHCTVTVFWIRLLDHVRSSQPDVGSLDEAIAAFPDLTDPHLPARHWSDIDAPEARDHWVEPDLAPMP